MDAHQALTHIFEQAAALETQFQQEHTHLKRLGVRGSKVDSELLMPLLKDAESWGVISIKGLEGKDGPQLSGLPEIKLAHALIAVQHTRKRAEKEANRLAKGGAHLPRLYGCSLGSKRALAYA